MSSIYIELLGEANDRIEKLEKDLTHYSNRSHKLDDECAGFEDEIKALREALEDVRVEVKSLQNEYGIVVLDTTVEMIDKALKKDEANKLPIYDNFMTPEDTVREHELYKSIVTRPDEAKNE